MRNDHALVAQSVERLLDMQEVIGLIPISETMGAQEKAVSFAASMIRKGEYIGKAVKVASSYYKVPYADVQSGLAARSGRSQRGRKKPISEHQCYSHGCNAAATYRLDAVSGYNRFKIAYSCAEKECMSNVQYVFGSERVDSGGHYRWTKIRAPRRPTMGA